MTVRWDGEWGGMEVKGILPFAKRKTKQECYLFAALQAGQAYN